MDKPGAYITHIKESCLYVKDTAISKQFYMDKLGFPCIVHEEGKHVFFRVGTSVLLCFVAEDSRKKTYLPAHFAQGEQHFAFEVAKADYEQTRALCVAQGITIEQDEVWGNAARSFYFRDPDRHLLEIVEHGLWDS